MVVAIGRPAGRLTWQRSRVCGGRRAASGGKKAALGWARQPESEKENVIRLVSRQVSVLSSVGRAS